MVKAAVWKVLDKSTNGSSSSSRRSRRSTVTESSIYIQRCEDNLEVHVGDCVTVEDEVEQVGLVAGFEPQPRGPCKMTIFWFNDKEEVGDLKDVHERELFLSPLQQEFLVDDIRDKVVVVSDKQFNNENDAYFCHRVCDEDGNVKGDIQYENVAELLAQGVVLFSHYIRDITAKFQTKKPLNQFGTDPEPINQSIIEISLENDTDEAHESSDEDVSIVEVNPFLDVPDLGPKTQKAETEEPQKVPEKTPRRRGRPPKSQPDKGEASMSPSPRKRGRPKKLESVSEPQKEVIPAIESPRKTRTSNQDKKFAISDTEYESSLDEEYHTAVSSPKRAKVLTPGKPKSSPLKKQTPSRSILGLSPKKTPTTWANKQEYQDSLDFMRKVLGLNKRVLIQSSLPAPQLPLIKKSKTKTEDYIQLDTSSDAFKDLKQKLHLSTKLSSLPCREDEFTTLYLNIETSIQQKTGCCLYVSGTPGIGKTATIKEVMTQMKELQSMGEIDEFNFIEINALKLINPNYAYTTLWNKISGLNVSPSNAALFLDAYFKEESDAKKTTVVMVDELDQMATKKQNVMYNFFNWPTYPNSKLIVIAVANTMDLPERVLSNKVSSRLGLKRIQFIGYTFEQLGTIIEHRLDMLTRQGKDKVIIDRDAINFASRKVASVSGDSRRALQICRRAVEIAELEYRMNPQVKTNGEEESFHVKIPHIAKAISETVNSPVAQYIASLSLGSKLILCALLLRMRRSGLSDNPLGEIIDEMKLMLAMSTSNHISNFNETVDFGEALLKDRLIEGNNRNNLRIDSFRYLIFELVENGILNSQDIKSERYKLISLNVSQDEVLTTLKRDSQVSKLL